MKLFYIILVCLLIGCSDNKNIEQQEQPPANGKPNFSRQLKKSNTSINQIFAIIDDVYSIDKNDDFFQSNTIRIDSIKQRYGLTSFDTSGALCIHSHGSFQILEYVNSDFSSSAFNSVFNDVKNDSATTNEGIEINYDVISKSGDVFFLLDNYIINKGRRCNDDWKKNEQLENLLTSKLFIKPPMNNYLIRVCCSCPPKKQIELK